MNLNHIQMKGFGDIGVPPGYWDCDDPEPETCKCRSCFEWFDAEEADRHGHCPECQSWYLDNPEELES